MPKFTSARMQVSENVCELVSLTKPAWKDGLQVFSVTPAVVRSVHCISLRYNMSVWRGEGKILGLVSSS